MSEIGWIRGDALRAKRTLAANIGGSNARAINTATAETITVGSFREVSGR